MNIKKIAITGHSKGIGKHLYEHLSKSYEVIGFSRSNGYDISKEADLSRILSESTDCEIFINNAYYQDQQTSLAGEWANLHSGQEHFIINVSSLASDPMFDIASKIPHLVPYAQEKQRLNQITYNICDQRDNRCKAMSILLGIVDTGFENPYGIDPTNLYEHYQDFKERGFLITVDDVTNAVEFMINSIKSNCFVYSLSLLNTI